MKRKTTTFAFVVSVTVDEQLVNERALPNGKRMTAGKMRNLLRDTLPAGTHWPLPDREGLVRIRRVTIVPVKES